MYKKANALLLRLRENKQLSLILYLSGLTLFILDGFVKGTMLFGKFGISYRITFYMLLLASSLVVVKILIYDDWINYKYLSYFLIVVVFYAIGSSSTDFGLMYYTIFIVGAKEIDFRCILKTFLVVILTGLLVVILLSSLDIIKSIKTYRPDSPIIRYALGTIYPTDLAARVFYLVMSYITLRKLKLSVPEYISLSSIVVLSYILTDTRLDLLLMVLALIFVALKKYVVKFFSNIKLWTINLAIICMISSFIILNYIYNPSNGILLKVNNVLSDRLYYGHKGFKRYNVQILGQYIEQNGWGGGVKVTDYFFIDSSYIRLIMMQGILAFIVVVIVILIINLKIYKLKAFKLYIPFILVLVSSMIDQHLLESSYNVFLLMLMSDLSSYTNNEKVI